MAQHLYSNEKLLIVWASTACIMIYLLAFSTLISVLSLKMPLQKKKIHETLHSSLIQGDVQIGALLLELQQCFCRLIKYKLIKFVVQMSNMQTEAKLKTIISAYMQLPRSQYACLSTLNRNNKQEGGEQWKTNKKNGKTGGKALTRQSSYKIAGSDYKKQKQERRGKGRGNKQRKIKTYSKATNTLTLQHFYNKEQSSTQCKNKSNGGKQVQHMVRRNTKDITD